MVFGQGPDVLEETGCTISTLHTDIVFFLDPGSKNPCLDTVGASPKVPPASEGVRKEVTLQLYWEIIHSGSGWVLWRNLVPACA